MDIPAPGRPPNPPSPPQSPRPAGTGGILDGMRRALIAYARWLDSISWKRFFVLSLLALIASGVLSNLPPFSTRWGASRVVTQVTPESSPPKGPAARDSRQRKKDRSYQIDIDKSGVHITPTRPSTAASTPVPPSPPALPDGASPPTPPVTPGAAREGVHIQLPENADTDEIRSAIEEAQAEIEDAIGEARTHVRIRGGFALGDHLPGFVFLLIVLSMVTKIMAAGRFKAEAKAVVATEIAESETLKRQVVEARMAAMQAQVEPHFLFNTLASIDHLIETDPKRASQMQKNLIALLRASMPTMREAHPAAHNLGREMAVIRPYLEILKVRMEDRLQTRIDVPDGLLSAEFPSMMIQSLVENAIKHGLEPKPEGGTLTVRAEIVHGKLAVTVADTGLGFGKAATAGTGTGLANIRERLALLYGSRASMVVAENSPSGTIVTLTVPYQSQAREGETA
jgi:two-component sensor histidine kinase